MKTRLSHFLSVTLTLCVWASAQTGSGKTPEATSDNGKSAKWDSLSNQARSGDYFLGKVTVTGGAAPWDPIAVIVTCDGKTRYTTATDSKGNFVITSTYSAGSSQVGADPHAKMASQFVGCDVQAALAGFDSSVLKIVNRSLVDDADIGTITLKREEGSSGAAVSATSLSAPKDASKAFEKARGEWQDKKPEAAQHDLEKAVKADPQFAEAWYQLGKIQETANSPEASASFSKAVAADPKFVLPYEHLASLAARTGNWEEVVSATAHELELNPRGSPQIWYYKALGNYKMNKKDVAEASALKSLAMDPLHTVPNTEQLLAVILADKRDFAGALEHLRNCLTYLPNGPDLETVKGQIAQLQKFVTASK
jgi:tetratricopeptide (TPR) repeat protein